ncbi:hypothetical protein GLYMA_07G053800v4 [Glycine max]|uniref:Uncharacterized protein n=1 Tax=Glycine max TaxID=3847 RepID=K7KZT7_SOYBN|nr:hypothetical protein GYH30_017489 [Glycine max]KRH47881.1 hypothetical protein GLYMA_07G053800v4 [Glycine max]
MSILDFSPTFESELKTLVSQSRACTIMKWHPLFSFPTKNPLFSNNTCHIYNNFWPSLASAPSALHIFPVISDPWPFSGQL